MADRDRSQVKETVTENVLNQVSEVDEDDVEEYVSEKVDEYFEYKVTDPDSITPEIVNSIQEDLGAVVESSGRGQTASYVDMDEISRGEKTESWVSVKGEVMELWDNDTDMIRQVGLISDGTAQVKFTIWEQDDEDVENFDKLEEGEQYTLQNVIVKEYEGNYDVQVQSNSEIEELEEEIDVDQGSEFRGDIVKMYDSSGLIKRNDDGRVIDTDSSEEGENDLRLKLAVDNGETVRTVIVGKELTEEITGITMSEAIEMAKDELDRSVVYNKMKNDLILQHVYVEGFTRGNYLIADSVEVGEPPVDDVAVSASELLMKMGDNQ